MKIDYAAQCRFFTPEDACRIALQAYYSASREIEPPPGQPWMADGDPWCSATDFAEAFNGHLQTRLALLALDRLGEFLQVSVLWDHLTLARDLEPEKMIPIIAKREAANAELTAEFSGLRVNDLPPEDNGVHNQSSREVDNRG